MDKDEVRRQLRLSDEQVRKRAERARFAYLMREEVPSAATRHDILTHLYAWYQEFGDLPDWHKTGFLCQLWAVESELRDHPEASGKEAMDTMDRDLVRYYAVLGITELKHPRARNTYSQHDAFVIAAQLLKSEGHTASRNAVGDDVVGEAGIEKSFKRMRKLDLEGALPVASGKPGFHPLTFECFDPERVASIASDMNPKKYPKKT